MVCTKQACHDGLISAAFFRLTCAIVDTCRCTVHEDSAIQQYALGVTLLLWVVAPVWQMSLPAMISTETEHLVNQLNELRAITYHPTEALKFSARAASLIEYLRDYNNGLGPGFVMFGTVVINMRVFVSSQLRLVLMTSLSFCALTHCCHA